MVTSEQFSPQRRLLASSEVATMLGVSRQRVHRLSQLGVLRPVRLVPGEDLRFRVEDVERLIRGETS
jgi:excisionase family DNA binding protein